MTRTKFFQQYSREYHKRNLIENNISAFPRFARFTELHYQIRNYFSYHLIAQTRKPWILSPIHFYTYSFILAKNT